MRVKLIQEGAHDPRPAWMFGFHERLGLDLRDALTGDGELVTNFLKGGTVFMPMPNRMRSMLARTGDPVDRRRAFIELTQPVLGELGQYSEAVDQSRSVSSQGHTR